MATAFSLRRDEAYLSVNWLEYLDEQDQYAAIGRVRETFEQKGFTVRPNGRFAVINVGAAKAIATECFQGPLSIEHVPLADDPSHSGIVGYTANDLAVAAALAVLVTPLNVHPAST